MIFSENISFLNNILDIDWHFWVPFILGVFVLIAVITMVYDLNQIHEHDEEIDSIMSTDVKYNAYARKKYYKSYKSKKIKLIVLLVVVAIALYIISFLNV